MLVGVEAERLFGQADLVLPERRAVCGGCVHRVRRGVGDVRAHYDQRRSSLLVDGILGRLRQGFQVLGVGDVLDVPPLSLEALALVLTVEGDGGRAVYGDAVVVVEVDELAQSVLPGQGGGLVGDALHQIAVGADGEDPVVHDLVPDSVVAVGQEALGHRHPHAVGEALPERTRGRLDAGRHEVLGVARRYGARLAEALDLVQRQGVAGQVQHRVLQDRSVPGGEDEAVPVLPAGVLRVVTQKPREDRVRQRGHGHRGAGVAVAGLLHRVHRQGPDRVYGTPRHVLFGLGVQSAS